MDLKRNNEMLLLPIQSRNGVIDLPVLAVLLSVVRGASELTASGATETMIKWQLPCDAFFIFQLLYNYNFFCLEDSIDIVRLTFAAASTNVFLYPFNL